MKNELDEGTQVCRLGYTVTFVEKDKNKKI